MKTFLSSILFCLLTSVAFAQNIQPLSIEQVLQMEKDGLPDSEIISSIKKNKVDFYFNRQAERTLIIGDVSDEVIDVVKENPPSSIQISNVKNGDSVNVYELDLQGISENVEGRKLWFFSHNKDLVDMWWPQGQSIHIEPETNKFSTKVLLGMPNDGGGLFEIYGVWLEEGDHQKIVDYIAEQNSMENPKWPPMSLPSGTPSIQIEIYKKGK